MIVFTGGDRQNAAMRSGFLILGNQLFPPELVSAARQERSTTCMTTGVTRKSTRAAIIIMSDAVAVKQSWRARFVSRSV